MAQRLHSTERRGLGYLSEPAVLRLGATVYVGSLANWIMMAPFAATSGFGWHFSFQVLAFAVPFAAGTIPARRWLSAHAAAARSVILGALAGDALLTPAAAWLPFGLELLALTLQGLLTAFAAGTALTRLRAGADSDHGGRILGGAGGFAVLTIMGSRALGAESQNLQGVLVQTLPLLLAAAATQWLPVSTQRPTPVVPKKTDIRWTLAACLMGCAVALTASAAFGSGGGTWTDVFCAAGFILSGVLLDTERLTICIGAAAVSAVLAALSSAPSSGAISGLAQGLVQPLPWYIVMTRLKRDSWVIILACGQAALWACWSMWNSTRQLDAALMSALVSFVALSIVSTFATARSLPVAQPLPLPVRPDAAPPETPEAEPDHAEASTIDSVADALKKIYGDVLTPRELQVGQLAVLGVSSRDIAAQLYLSESTVKTHLKSLYRKTDAANRNELYRRLMAGTGDDVPGPPASNRLTAALMAAPKDPVTELIARQAFERVATERMLVDQVNRRPTGLLYMVLRLEGRGADKQSPAVAVVAGILRASLRSMDLLFRYGDFEFVAILSGSDGPGANLAGQRLAHRIRAWAASRPSPVDVEVGWASTADGAQTLTALLAEAIGGLATHSL